MKAHPIDPEISEIVFTVWQYDPKAPRPVWVCRVAHKLDLGQNLSMINHAHPGGVIEIQPTDWFIRDPADGTVMVLTDAVFKLGFEILPDESKPKD
jgi:hypothetical protein